MVSSVSYLAIQRRVFADEGDWGFTMDLVYGACKLEQAFRNRMC